MAQSNCEMCAYYTFDEDYDGYVCMANMDEDDYVKFITSKDKGCPFFRVDDEYKIVRKQN